MKPTVSLSSTRRFDGSMNCRTVGSSVANMRASATTPAPVSRLNKVDLPALVYPTRLTVASGTDWRCRRWMPRPARTDSRSPSILLIRCRIFRRSISNCVSPGPRVPMPPPSRDIWMPRPASLGSR